MPEIQEPLPDASRRGFLQWTLGGLLFGGLVVAGNVVLRYLMPPPPRMEKAGKVSIPVSQIPPGTSLMLKHQGAPVLAVHTEQGISAFSAVCPHLGCLVKWMPAEKIFYCPCHAGKFDARGKVIAGPPPEPLPPVKFEIVDDNIIFL